MVLVSFKVATLDDFKQCRQFDFSHVPDDWLKQSIKNGWVYLVEENAKVIGYARLEYIWLSLPYIGLITLEDEYQRKGIGTALIDRISQDLTEQGHRALYTSTEDEGTPEFYQKCGFSQCGTISEINETGNEEIYFIRYLQKK
jgi:N-acetylglutamate synthase-like GNAT family acetyltransferase